MKTLLFIIVSLLWWSLSPGADRPAEWHSNPACWTKARDYHSGPVRQDLRKNYSLTTSGESIQGEQNFSPNQAYYYVRHQNPSDRLSHEIRIFHERPYILKFSLSKVDGLSDVRWLNEKLLFIRAWWGRIQATDFIIDVETEKIIFEEMLTAGWLAYQQFQGQCKAVGNKRFCVPELVIECSGLPTNSDR